MELITHALTGIFIQILCYIFFIFPLNLILTIIVGFFSHFFIDSLAKITYHTPEPHKEDKFWVAWHIITPVLAILLAIWVIIIGQIWFFLIGVIFANLVDILDWMIIRPYVSKHLDQVKEKYKEKPFIFHKYIDFIRDKVPPFKWFPNWNHEKKGVIIEIATITTLWISVYLMLPLINS